jgi:hypothetical protein
MTDRNNMEHFKILLCLFFLTICFLPNVQASLKNLRVTNSIDTIISKKDSTIPKKISYPFSTNKSIPKRAAMYSALLPGLGQVYNKQYWKLPIVYGGLAFAAYTLNKEYSSYQKNRQLFIYKTDGNPNTIDSSVLSASQLYNLQKDNRSKLDKYGVYTTVFYALNIIDALASAHMKDFDVSKNISLHWKPVIEFNNIGIAVAANIK